MSKTTSGKNKESIIIALNFRSCFYTCIFLTFDIQKRLLINIQFAGITIKHSYQRRLQNSQQKLLLL